MNDATAKINCDDVGDEFPSLDQHAHTTPTCFHCGTICSNTNHHSKGKVFCCSGCQTVFELLSENNLDNFYKLSTQAGVRINAPSDRAHFAYLDEPTVRARLVNFSDARITRISFRIPAVHCIACVWLLENLFRLKPGVGESHVNFPQKLLSVTFRTTDIKLSDVVSLLASLGYEPDLKLSDLDSKPRFRPSRRLWIQLGLAGFAFGNIMLFSISAYLGLDAYAGPGFRKMIGVLSLLLSLPVFTYSALDYWLAARTSLKQRLLNIDVPIAAGIAAIFFQSSFEVLSGRGDGYFDSLCGLIFFLLCGRSFQQKTYDRLTFDRDYKSLFPLSVTRKLAQREEEVSLAQLHLGDRLLIRNGQLIPADATLIAGPAMIDYSFVTGEAEPIEKKEGDLLYAGGRQMGGVLEIEMVKPVSQSYLTSLWDQEAFRKDNADSLNALTNKYSQRFTKLILGVAIGAAIYWAVTNSALAVKAFTSVLIVACPCALALAAPFALGTAHRLLARRGIYLKNPFVLEKLARIDAIVFDKTGTLTAPGVANVTWTGTKLTPFEQTALCALAHHSTHPLAIRITGFLSNDSPLESVRSFREIPGRGIQGNVQGHEIYVGAATWIESLSTKVKYSPSSSSTSPSGSTAHVVIDGLYRGHFVLSSAIRPEVEDLVSSLKNTYELALLSGDNEKERERFLGLFNDSAELRFNQSPLDKLQFIQQRQEKGEKVMMVGDGLNDSGALKQSDVGVAVVENISAFSPASDVILKADAVSRLPALLRFARKSVRIVRTAFLISAAYNAVGIGIAASGRLSPIVCAILMPLSSVSVVAFGCLAAMWSGRNFATDDFTKNAKRLAISGEPFGTLPASLSPDAPNA